MIAVGLLPQNAKADQIIGGSSQDVTFTGLGSGDLSAMFGTCSFNGADTTCALSGSGYSLNITYAGATDTTAFGPNNGFGVFPVTANWLSSTITLGATTNSLTYSAADDGSANPHVDGTWGGGTTFDYTLNAITCTGLGSLSCTLDNVANTSGATAFATISQGEFVTIPEPAWLLLFGSGLLGLAGILRRRVRRWRGPGGALFPFDVCHAFTSLTCASMDSPTAPTGAGAHFLPFCFALRSLAISNRRLSAAPRGPLTGARRFRIIGRTESFRAWICFGRRAIAFDG